MPTNRRALKRSSRRRITDAAIEAWKAADYKGLHRALGLTVCDISPLPYEIISLGVSEDEDVEGYDDFRKSNYQQALELQRELLAIAGWPDCRAAYEENLAEAVKWSLYCRSLVDHPERGGQGTGCDPVSRRRKLEQAEEEVVYRKQLLDELEEAAR